MTTRCDGKPQDGAATATTLSLAQSTARPGSSVGPIFARRASAQGWIRWITPEKAGSLPDVDVLGSHFIKVLPDRRDAFERFVRDTLHPAVANLRPDLRLLYYKAIRGAEAPGYILLFALTKQSRDKYWPGGSDSDALRAAFGPVTVHRKELSTYLVPGSALADEKFAAAIYESREWTDLVLVPSGSR